MMRLGFLIVLCCWVTTACPPGPEGPPGQDGTPSNANGTFANGITVFGTATLQDRVICNGNAEFLGPLTVQGVNFFDGSSISINNNGNFVFSSEGSPGAATIDSPITLNGAFTAGSTAMFQGVTTFGTGGVTVINGAGAITAPSVSVQTATVSTHATLQSVSVTAASTFDGGLIATNGTGGLTVRNLKVTRQLTLQNVAVQGSAGVGGALTTNTLTTTGAAILSSTLHTAGAATMGTTLTVVGAFNTDNAMIQSDSLGGLSLQSLTVAHALHSDSNLIRSNGTGALTVKALAISNGPLTVNGRITASSITTTGNAQFGGTLGSTGLATLGSLQVTGASTVSGNLVVQGTTTLDNGAISTTGGGQLTAAGAILAGSLATTGAGTLYVGGASTLDNGAITTSGSGAITASTLTVTGHAILPLHANSADLGSLANPFANIFATRAWFNYSVIEADIVDIANITTNELKITGTLLDAGHADIKTTGMATIGTLHVTGASTVNGHLAVLGSTSLDNGGITTNGLGALTTAANTNVGGQLSVLGTLTTDNGAITTDGVGSMQINGQLFVIGTTNLDNGAIGTNGLGGMLVGSLQSLGQVDVSGDLIVTGVANVHNNAVVFGSFDACTNCNHTVSVAPVTGALTVGGRTFLDWDAAKNVFTSGAGDLTVDGLLDTGTFFMGTGASAGYVLTSDFQGYGTWQPAAGATTLTADFTPPTAFRYSVGTQALPFENVIAKNIVANHTLYAYGQYGGTSGSFGLVVKGQTSLDSGKITTNGNGAIVAQGTVTAAAFSTTGTLGAGAATVSSLNAGSGAITTTGTLSSGAATVTSLNAGSGTITTTGQVSVTSVQLNSLATIYAATVTLTSGQVAALANSAGTDIAITPNLPSSSSNGYLVREVVVTSAGAAWTGGADLGIFYGSHTQASSFTLPAATLVNSNTATTGMIGGLGTVSAAPSVIRNSKLYIGTVASGTFAGGSTGLTVTVTFCELPI